VCREKGISEATFYAWRKKLGGMQVKEAQRLRDLEENARLKRLLAEPGARVRAWRSTPSRRSPQKIGDRCH